MIMNFHYNKILMPSNLRILFLGNHTVGVRTIDTLRLHSNLVGVVAHPEDPEDGVRYESVFSEAKKAGIPAIRAAGTSPALKEFIKSICPDLIWVVDYKYLLSKEVIDLAPMGAINFHPSLLPAYRGRASINWAIIRGESTLGLTAHYIDKGMDTGDIIGQLEYYLSDDEDVGDALHKLYPLYQKMTEDVIRKFSTGNIHRKVQSKEGISVFPSRRPDDGLVIWGASAVKVRNLVRAVAAPYPGAFTPFLGGYLRIWKVGKIEPLPAHRRTKPGEVLECKDGTRLVVACLDAALVLSKFEIEKSDRLPVPGDILGEVNPVINVPHNALMHGEEEVIAVTKVVRSGKWAGSPCIEDTESRFARAAGTKHACAVGTGLGALRLALRAIGICQGDDVAVPGYSCVALANAVLACGANPVPIEIEPTTLNISPKALVEMVRVNPRIRAAIAVHTFGFPADIENLAKAGVPLIEDCSHAFGRSGFGSNGRVALMSLYATKLVGAGEGGMIFTNDSDIMQNIREARDYTDLPPDGYRLNDKPSSFTAALAGCQLDRLPESLNKRDYLAERYFTAFDFLAREGLCRLPLKKSGRVWYRYAIQLHQNVDKAISALRTCGVISAKPVEPWSIPPGKHCAEAFSQTISLPMFPALTDYMQDHVIKSFLKFV